MPGEKYTLHDPVITPFYAAVAELLVLDRPQIGPTQGRDVSQLVVEHLSQGLSYQMVC